MRSSSARCTSASLTAPTLATFLVLGGRVQDPAVGGSATRKTGIPGATAAISASVDFLDRPSTNRPTSQPHLVR